MLPLLSGMGLWVGVLVLVPLLLLLRQLVLL